MRYDRYKKQRGPVYKEGFDPVQEAKGELIQGILGVDCYCFYKNKFIVVFDGKKKYWAPVKGGIEAGETFEEAVIREVKEEANMKILHQEFIGFKDFYDPEGIQEIRRITSSLCIVEPYGDFLADPDGDITEIKLIDPADYKQYYDWGIVGEYIIKKAMDMKKQRDLLQ